MNNQSGQSLGVPRCYGASSTTSIEAEKQKQVTITVHRQWNYSVMRFPYTSTQSITTAPGRVSSLSNHKTAPLLDVTSEVPMINMFR